MLARPCLEGRVGHVILVEVIIMMSSHALKSYAQRELEPIVSCFSRQFIVSLTSRASPGTRLYSVSRINHARRF